MLEFQEFMEEVIKKLEKQCEMGCDIRTLEVPKNNGVKKVGLVMKKGEEKYSPIVYMEPYYEEYKNGISIEQIVYGITAFIKGCNPEIINIDQICDYEQMKDRLFFRLVNYEKNKGALVNVPHIPYLDLAIIFSLSLDEKGYNTAAINNNLMNTWGKTVGELYEQAKLNTPLMLGMSFRSMNEVLLELVKKSLKDECDIASLEKSLDKQAIIPLYVLGNNICINGAAVILYDDILKGIAERFKSDLVIIPSSIHEVLIVIYEEDFDVSKLKEMVQNVNRSEVQEVDILSDNVYIYNREKDIVYMVE